MPITRDDYRLAMLQDATAEWQPLAGPVVRAADDFPDLTAAGAEVVVGIHR
ncbi:MAG TPA: hypothetical protein VF494_03815 [Candidatus Limnocylindrales bacterium]